MKTTERHSLDDHDLRRFWSYVDKRGPRECWPWLCQGGGAPAFHYGGRGRSALITMYELHYGEAVPPGHIVLRTCGVTGNACINPHHMVVVQKGLNHKYWYRRQITEGRRSIHALADLAGFDLVPTENGHYKVKDRYADADQR